MFIAQYRFPNESTKILCCNCSHASLTNVADQVKSNHVLTRLLTNICVIHIVQPQLLLASISLTSNKRNQQPLVHHPFGAFYDLVAGEP